MQMMACGQCDLVIQIYSRQYILARPRPEVSLTVGRLGPWERDGAPSSFRRCTRLCARRLVQVPPTESLSDPPCIQFMDIFYFIFYMI